MNNIVVIDICFFKIYIYVDNIIWIKGDGLFKLLSYIMIIVVLIIGIIFLLLFFKNFINIFKILIILRF